MRVLTMGSLFDGLGTMPLAGWLCGVKPLWASEIEKYPMEVTKARFPDMVHLGDITQVNGAEIPPVDIVCGGSPCQDLSVAGRRAGLNDGERSHLFYEMVRIIDEMRGATNGEYPRWVVWENVPGAFSSNDGRDFLAVLQHFAEIADCFVDVPEPEKRNGKLKWSNAGEMVGDDWSIAWRVVDAQWWGVPQRRRRIWLVLDLGRRESACRGGQLSDGYTSGGRAGEVLFEQAGLRGYPPQGFRTRESVARNTGDGTEESG